MRSLSQVESDHAIVGLNQLEHAVRVVHTQTYNSERASSMSKSTRARGACGLIGSAGTILSTDILGLNQLEHAVRVVYKGEPVFRKTRRLNQLEHAVRVVENKDVLVSNVARLNQLEHAVRVVGDMAEEFNRSQDPTV